MDFLYHTLAKTPLVR